MISCIEISLFLYRKFPQYLLPPAHEQLTNNATKSGPSASGVGAVQPCRLLNVSGVGPRRPQTRGGPPAVRANR